MELKCEALPRHLGGMLFTEAAHLTNWLDELLRDFSPKVI